MGRRTHVRNLPKRKRPTIRARRARLASVPADSVPMDPERSGLPFAPGWGLFLLRLVFGLGLMRHGMGKWGQMDAFTQTIAALGFPLAEQAAWAAMGSEFLGGALWVLGWKTRLASFFIGVTMSVAVFLQYAQDPFEKKETALAYLAVAGVLFIAGPGRWSLDRSERNLS